MISTAIRGIPIVNKPVLMLFANVIPVKVKMISTVSVFERARNVASLTFSRINCSSTS